MGEREGEGRQTETDRQTDRHTKKRSESPAVPYVHTCDGEKDTLIIMITKEDDVVDNNDDDDDSADDIDDYDHCREAATYQYDCSWERLY